MDMPAHLCNHRVIQPANQDPNLTLCCQLQGDNWAGEPVHDYQTHRKQIYNQTESFLELGFLNGASPQPFTFALTSYWIPLLGAPLFLSSVSLSAKLLSSHSLRITSIGSASPLDCSRPLANVPKASDTPHVRHSLSSNYPNYLLKRHFSHQAVCTFVYFYIAWCKYSTGIY